MWSVECDTFRIIIVLELLLHTKMKVFSPNLPLTYAPFFLLNILYYPWTPWWMRLGYPEELPNRTKGDANFKNLDPMMYGITFKSLPYTQEALECILVYLVREVFYSYACSSLSPNLTTFSAQLESADVYFHVNFSSSSCVGNR